ncbi:hypothetical protein [Sphingobacterium mizutaii]|uniref:hypothetical protein n=1 Tax=Sphingobacterium mizutaii TaxID=1010 RepID=UPI0028967C3B|nr:hypothetical protein [Sphingobacterium mizutaii]
MTLMCFCQSEQDQQHEEMLESMGIPRTEPLKMAVYRMTFYSVDNIGESEFSDGKSFYGTISSGGAEYCTNVPFELLEGAVEEHLYGER